MPVWSIILVVFGGVICCGLCVYGISTTVRRSEARRDPNAHALTHS
jgi:hypothetical protein